MLARIVERVSRATGLDGVAVLTTDSDRDAPLRALCREIEVPVVAGSEHDVLDRFMVGVRELSPSYILRVTADCPLVDPEVLSRLIELFWETEGCAYAAVASGAMVARPGLRRYPDGLDAEIVSSETLQLAWNEALDPYEREHVTPFVWRRPERFRLATLQAPEDWGQERWTVDYPADLAFVRAVYARLEAVREFGLDDVRALLQREPALRAVNAAEREKASPVR